MRSSAWTTVFKPRIGRTFFILNWDCCLRIGIFFLNLHWFWRCGLSPGSAYAREPTSVAIFLPLIILQQHLHDQQIWSFKCSAHGKIENLCSKSVHKTGNIQDVPTLYADESTSAWNRMNFHLSTLIFIIFLSESKMRTWYLYYTMNDGLPQTGPLTALSKIKAQKIPIPIRSAQEERKSFPCLENSSLLMCQMYILRYFAI